MGSKTPEGQQHNGNGTPAPAAGATVNPPKSAAATGLLHGALEGQDEHGDDDDDGTHDSGADLKADNKAASSKKKRKRNNKKNKKKTAPGEQTAPPRIRLADLFPNDQYPEGQTVDYTNHNENLQRTTAGELRHQAALANMNDDYLNSYREAAEIHRQVRQYARTIAKPGISMSALAREIEDGVLSLTGHPGTSPGNPLKAGLGFPVGLCLNNVAAHWTPNPGSKDVYLKQDDVLSIDFGVHVRGLIVDSAFTISHNPIFSPLLAAPKAATEAGLREAGIDARIDEISAAIQEVMESYEVELKGKSIPVKSVRNITGHNILPYQIHGSKQVPFIATKTSQRMEEGDVFAIETFGTTGKAVLRDDIGVYGYSRKPNAKLSGLHMGSAKSLLKQIDESFGTIPFSRSSLERLGVKGYHLGMRSLVQSGVVEEYAPLADVVGSYVAQFEHTVLLRPNCKEIISRGDDY